MKPTTVIKLGGSLLDWHGLATALPEFLEQFQGQPIVLIVGGGSVADGVRQFDRHQGLGQERAHRLALRALDLTAWWLAELLPGVQVVDRLDRLPEVWARSAVPVLQPRQVLDEDEHVDPASALPHHWDVTTDSIAAHLALRLGAPSLHLLKSRPVAPGLDTAAAAREGIVDAYFPQASRRLDRIVCVDLRAPDWQGTVVELRRTPGLQPADSEPGGS